MKAADTSTYQKKKKVSWKDEMCEDSPSLDTDQDDCPPKPRKLKRVLRLLSGPELLEVAVQRQEIFDHAEPLFKKLCRKENVGKTSEDSTYTESYCHHYFKQIGKETRKKAEWECALRTIIATRKVRRRNEMRKVTQLRTKTLDTAHTMSSSKKYTATPSTSKTPQEKKSFSGPQDPESHNNQEKESESHPKKKKIYAPLYEKSRKDRLMYTP